MRGTAGRLAGWLAGLMTGTHRLWAHAEGKERSKKEREVVISALFDRAGLIGGAGEIS